jgi:rhodanese-related sulfurtransferase
MTGMLRGPVAVTIRDAAIVTVACGAAALIVNAARPDGIPLVQQKDYEIYVPCPETLGHAERMGPVQFLNLEEDKVLVIDARDSEAFGAWHHPGAVNVPFDYLMPVCTVSLKEIASSGARKVIVYGDGADPDSGKELARELSGNGIRNVYWVKGGAPLLRDGTSREGP